VNADSPVRAAGCVVWRGGDPEPKLLLVHRPRYDDWSFPKGKLDSGETAMGAATREVLEETGLRVRLGPRLPDQKYTVSGGQPKLVTYWAGRAMKGSSIKDYEATDEVDTLRWLPASQARKTLSYSRDRTLLDAFLRGGYDSEPLLVVRHAEARKRSAWKADDAKRPLKLSGKEQAARLVPLLAAYGVSQVVSSNATRCVQTVRPYVKASGAQLSEDPVLSEDGYDERGFAQRVEQLLKEAAPTAVCTHRPQLRPFFEVAGVESIGLMPAEVVVLHHIGGSVVDCEQHAV
jgi:8-oxo-dGTP pyrophosphatase MutT (NUDIX family)/phosphohistidine phosphatase SixA